MSQPPNGAPKAASGRSGLNRRTLFKLAPLVPLAVNQAGQAVAETLTKQMSVAAMAGVADSMSAGMSASLVPGMYYGDKVSKKLLTLYKLGLLPDWFKHEMVRDARYNMTGIEPDIAGLASVSLGHKCRMQIDRVVARKMDGMEAGLIDDLVRQAFYSELDQP